MPCALDPGSAPREEVTCECGREWVRAVPGGVNIPLLVDARSMRTIERQCHSANTRVYTAKRNYLSHPNSPARPVLRPAWPEVRPGLRRRALQRARTIERQCHNANTHVYTAKYRHPNLQTSDLRPQTPDLTGLARRRGTVL